LNVAHAVAHGGFGRACLYALDRGMVPHAHREGHLIFHLGGPEAEMVVDGRSFPLSAGQGVAINPWQPHYCRTIDSSSHVMMLVIYIKPQWFVDSNRQAQGDLRFGCIEVAVTEQIGRLVQQVRFLLSEHYAAEGNLDGCMTELARAAHDQTWRSAQDGGRRAGDLARASDFRIRRALRLLDDTLGEPIDLASVSRAAGLSRPHFFKLFREQIGVPPTIYLNTLRLERAIDRLARGEENVAEIGLGLGFSTAASFSRFFAANSVVPPSAYRRSVHARSLQ
jgi:AraC-like DNA-binding protein/mannose-6-phosphate isomerase-like protein (cupin superfamily)